MLGRENSVLVVAQSRKLAIARPGSSEHLIHR